MQNKLERGEIVAVVGGIMLGISVFLGWYELGNENATLSGYGPGPGHVGESLSAWQALTITRVLLLLAAVAPFILAYIIVRGHALSWPRGELTAVIAIVAITLVVVRGVIIKPGSPPGQIHLEVGWFAALLSGFVILVGALIHRQKHEDVRKPPGVM